MKKLIVGLVLITLVVTGCNKVNVEEETDQVSGSDVVSNADEDKDLDDDALVDTPDEVTEPGIIIPDLGTAINTDMYKPGEVISTGEILSFSDGQVQIIMGDIAQVFDYVSVSDEVFYLNQYVSVIKGEKGDYLKAEPKSDFSRHYTNMGMPYEMVKGSVTGLTDESITIQTADEAMELALFEPKTIELGTIVEAYYVSYGQGPSLAYLLNEDTMLALRVTDISRSEAGEMILSLEDQAGGEYVIGTQGPMIEFNFAEVSVGDTLQVYHEGIMESWPMQLQTVLIRK